MRKHDCEMVRRELDELTLGASCSAAVIGHLQECSECSEFEEKQTKLRQIVGSLGTVAAPPDFDFRLRARLANESSKATFHLQSASWLFARRGLAVAALVLLIATGVVVVRNIADREEPVQITESNQPTNRVQQPGPTVPTEPAGPATQNKEQAVKGVEVAAGGQDNPRRLRPSQAVVRPRRIVAEDFSSERAAVFNADQTVSSSGVFPIDASLESLKVSLDDGRGNARTISLPTIRFGSQRMLPTVNQYAAKGVW